MTARRWVRVARSDEVGPPPFTPVEVDGVTVLVTRLPGGDVVAFGSACPHTGQPLHLGQLYDGCIECPYHFYAYDPRTGVNTSPGDATDAPLAVHHAREREGWVEVALAQSA